MTFKTILVCLSDVETAPAALDTAIRFARAHDAHVEALHVRIDPAAAIPLVGEGMSGAMVEEMLAAAERQAGEIATQVRGKFDQACLEHGVRVSAVPAPGGVTASWTEQTGREEEVLAEAARLTDLVVMPRPHPGHDIPALMSINAALMESGRPLLLVPPTPPADFGRNIAVFWNGSVEAARAVAAALPILVKAEKVTILSAREEKAAVPAQLASYLAWHGVQAETKSFSAGNHVPQSLLAEAVGVGADMAVMGAYTHSRLRQFILGGVTRHILETADLPVLLSH